MASIASIPAMRSRALAIMATRSQDQHLVSDVANRLPVRDPSFPAEDPSCAVIPSFGWHPWFSHQLYDDSSPNPTYQTRDDHGESQAKSAHYAAVLAPSPGPDDQAFLSSLPTPTPLSSLLSSTRSLLSSYPNALVGEIGLDKAFRLPRQWDSADAASRDGALTPGGREGRMLSPHRVRPQHQQAILTAQLRLAGEMGRPVSIHGVQAHGILYNTVAACWKGHEREVVSRRQQRLAAPGAESESEPEEDPTSAVGGKPFPPRICLHSFTGSVEVLHQWLNRSTPAAIFFSFSPAVNLGTEGGRKKLADVVAQVPDDRILVESDLHTAGEDMDAALEEMYRLVCEMKGWDLEEGVRRIGGNFREFIFGSR
ncbi:Cut9-interacting protein scn1 [Amphichorda felina]